VTEEMEKLSSLEPVSDARDWGVWVCLIVIGVCQEREKERQ
jgi:hypothetical protein